MATRSAKCPRCQRMVTFDENAAESIICPNCRASLSPPKRAANAPPDPLVGTALGEFEILEAIGRGGMGAVYKARQPSLDRLVALKVLRPPSADPGFAARFTREARAAARVNHPNIIEVYAVGAAGGHQYIAMELVAGGGLGRLVRRRGPLPAERAVALLKQVAAALAKAHDANLLPRDIKPANILLTADGLAKVADFGLAKRIEGDVAVTQAGRVVGTSLYMAPEVAAGKPADTRSDLYSLGATFYYVLAGNPPFKGSSPTELALKHSQDPVPPLASVAPDTPTALCRLVHRLLRKKPGDRYQSAAELLDALARVEQRLAQAHDGPSSAELERLHASAAGRRTAKQQDRRKIAIYGAVGTAAGILILIAAVLLTRDGAGTPRPPDQARARATTAKTRAAVPGPARPASRQPVGPAVPAVWANYLRGLERRAQTLRGEERYGKAITLYESVATRSPEVFAQARLQGKIDALRREAAAAYRDAEAEARRLLEGKRFAPARLAIQPAIDLFGTEPETAKAQRLLAEIDEAAERHRTEHKPKTPPGDPPQKPKDPPDKPDDPPAPPEEDPEAAAAARKAAEQTRRQADADFAKACRPAEELMRAWQFAKASDALATLEFDDPYCAQRLATRQVEAQLLAKLKAKMIDKISNAQPPLDKRALLIAGLNGTIVEATRDTIRASIPNKGEEGHPWKTLSPRSARLLAKLAADRTQADDCLAAGLLAFLFGDDETAVKDFEDARKLGAAIDRHLTAMAAGVYAKALALLKAKQYADAAKALGDIETRFGKTPWHAAHKDFVAVALRRAKSAGTEAAAEGLYKQAAALYKRKDYLELKPIVKKLTEDYPDSAAVTDSERDPCVADMVEATDKLGKIIVVRKDGAGAFKTIQAAIDAAPPRSIIVIADSHIYSERLAIPEAKEGLTLRGKRGAWPIIGVEKGAKRVFRRILDVEAADVTVDGIVFALRADSGSSSTTYSSSSRGGISVRGGNNFRIRRCVLSPASRYSSSLVDNSGGATQMDHCVLAQSGSIGGALIATNTICLGARLYSSSSYSSRKITLRLDGQKEPIAFQGVRLVNCAIYRFECYGPCEIRNCTLPGGIELDGEPSVVLNSITSQIDSSKHDTRIDCCNVYGKLLGKPPFIEFARPGKRCMSRNPLLYNLKAFDYRLRSASPCRKKASDGGDLGCRYTKQMQAMLQLANKLRTKGIIQFKPISDKPSYYD